MMVINPEVSLGTDMEVEEAMGGKLVEHMVQKWDAGVDIAFSSAVEIDGNGDRGLASVS